MNSTLTHKGLTARVEFDADNRFFVADRGSGVRVKQPSFGLGCFGG